MPASPAERQRKHRRKLKDKKYRQLQVMLPPDAVIALDSLGDASHTEKTELITRLILEEAKRTVKTKETEAEVVRKNFEGLPPHHGSW
jgi:hypothetical protein